MLKASQILVSMKNDASVCREVNKKLLAAVLDHATICHKTAILQQPSVKDAHMYCKIHQLSGQVSGPLIEHYIQESYHMTKNKASDCVGDVQFQGVNLEIKASLGGKKNNQFNYVQLRVNHVCEYLLTAYYLDQENLDNLGELFLFRLTKEQMKPLLLQYGGYAHGTVTKLGRISHEDLSNPVNDKEYALRPKYGDKLWQALLPFRIQEITV